MDLISVIVINWNGRDLLPECLESLQNQEFRRFSITVVDNGSTDGSVEFVTRNYPWVEIIILPANVGFAAANNVAFRTVKTEYVALLNNDAVAHPMWLKNSVEALKMHPEAGFAASKIFFYDRRNAIDRAGDGYTTAGAGFFRGRGMQSDAYDKQEWIFGACAAAAFYRKSMLDDIGFFDEDFFLIHEDVDLSFRAQLKGYRCLYVPEAIVYHKASRSIIHDSSTSVYYGHRNLEWVYVKNMPGHLIIRTILLHILYDMAAFLFFTANGRMKDFVRSKAHALKGLKKSLEKRRRIQTRKIVGDAYIWNLLERERFFPRLTTRFGINPNPAKIPPV